MIFPFSPPSEDFFFKLDLIFILADLCFNLNKKTMFDLNTYPNHMRKNIQSALGYVNMIKRV